MKIRNFLLWIILISVSLANAVSASEICQYASSARATSQHFGSLAEYAIGAPNAPNVGECDGWLRWSGYGYSWTPRFWFIKANLSLGYKNPVYATDFTIFGDYDICWDRIWLRNSMTGEERLVFEGFDEDCLSKKDADGDFLADTIILETCGWSWSSTDAVELCGIAESLCGNGISENGEECDDGENNNAPCQPYNGGCSYCSGDCETVILSSTYCGDGFLDGDYEECDDGNNENGDGCDGDCNIELCYNVDCSYLDNECNYGECNPSCGGCEQIPKMDGSSCWDDNACTQNDVCSDGICLGATIDCDDQNICTDDSCDSQLGCQHSYNTDPCDDYDECTQNDVCSGGVCQGAEVFCDDGVSCTVDMCDSKMGCVNTPDDSLCNNALWCDGVEYCDDELGCQGGTAPNCDDNIACTADSCNEGTGSCRIIPNDADCDDGLYCNGQEYCDIGLGCQSGLPIDCSDMEFCTVNEHCDEEFDTCVIEKRDCSDNNIPGIADCDNDPDNNQFTWDYRESFISDCDEVNDKCTEGCTEISHGCDMDRCNANCEDVCWDYCEGDILYYDGVCNDCVCERLTKDCNGDDGWYDTSEGQWVRDQECTEKEQKLEEYRDYSCGHANCAYEAKENRWVDTGETRNMEDGTSCDDGNLCTENDVCLEGGCGGTEKDCSAYDIGSIGECFYDPDHIDFTWDYREEFISECDEATGECAKGDITITHECSIDNCNAGCIGDYDCPEKCTKTSHKLYDFDGCIDCECDYSNPHCVVGGCGAECDGDSDCRCEQDYCDGTTFVDYPEYGRCGTNGKEGCLCQIDPNKEEECKPILDYCNLDCGAECSGESDCDYGEVCSYDTCSCVCSPMDEVCDGRDNDCDGLIDEGEEMELIIESTTEDDEQVYLDGNWLSSNWVWDEKTVNNVVLETGGHVLALRLKNWGWYPGFIVSVFHHNNEVLFNAQEDGTWLYSTDCSGDWASPEFDDTSWQPLESVGFFGSPHWGYRPDDWRDYTANWLWASNYTEICVRKRFEIFTYLEKECGEGGCEGYRLCVDGAYGDCSTQYDDCGVCCECDEDGMETYDSHQGDDCMPTICPESGCGYSNCAQYSLFPEEVENGCAGLFECSKYECEAECLDEDISTGKLSFRAEGGDIIYIGDDPEFSLSDVDLSGWFTKIFHESYVDGVTSLEVTAKTGEGKRVVLNVRMDLKWAIVSCDEIYGTMNGRGTYYKQGRGREAIDCEAEYWIDRISETVDIQGSCNGIKFRIEDINNLRFV